MAAIVWYRTVLLAAGPHQPVGVGAEEPQHGEQLDEARDITPVGSDHGDQAHADGKGAKAPDRQQQHRSAGATFVGDNALGGGSINDTDLLPTLHLSFETHVTSVVDDPRQDCQGQEYLIPYCIRLATWVGTALEHTSARIASDDTVQAGAFPPIRIRLDFVPALAERVEHVCKRYCRAGQSPQSTTCQPSLV